MGWYLQPSPQPSPLPTPLPSPPGYMSRRLMKALEDLYAHYDATVRNAAGGIVQLLYGEDGMDPVAMEGKDGKPLDFGRLMAKVREGGRGVWGAGGHVKNVCEWGGRWLGISPN